VLMFLSPDMRRRVIHRLMTSLAEDGWLIVSPAETYLVEAPTLRPIRFPGVIFHKKVPSHGPDETKMETVGHPLSRRKRPLLAAPRPSFRPAAPVSAVKPFGPQPGALLLKRESRDEKPPDLYQQAVAFYDKGLYIEAVETLERLLSVESGAHSTDMTQAMMLLAKVYADLGRLEEARKWCEKAAAMEKLDPDVHSLLAVIYQELGLTEEPIKTLKRVIYLDPDRVMAYFSLGHLMRQQGRGKAAKRFFISARDLLASMKPDETVPHSDGLTAERLKDAIEMMMDG